MIPVRFKRLAGGGGGGGGAFILVLSQPASKQANDKVGEDGKSARKHVMLSEGNQKLLAFNEQEVGGIKYYHYYYYYLKSVEGGG